MYLTIVQQTNPSTTSSASFITLAAGVIFKPVIFALSLVLLGSQVGLLGAVVLGRTVLRPWVEKRIRDDPTIIAIDRAITREGM
jgi:uncharacterized membrane protein YdjX (TVP38/TMEM64 family)